MAGSREDLDAEIGELQRLAAGERVLRLVALEGAEAGRRVAHDVLEHRAFELGAVDRRAALPRDRRDGADVIEVAVGDEDRVELDVERAHRTEQPLGFFARVDEHAVLRLPAGARDVGVCLYRPEREGPDVELAHGSTRPPVDPCACLRCRRRQSHMSV